MSDSDTLATFFDKVRNAGTFSLKKVKEEANTAEEAYKALVSELEAVKSEHSVTTQKLADTGQLSETRSSEITTLNTKVSDLTKEVEGLRKEKGELESKLSSMTKTATANADSAEQWKAAEETCRSEYAKLRDELSALSSAHETLTAEHAAVTEELASERSTHLADNEQARVFRDQYLSLESELNEAKKESKNLQDEVNTYTSERDAKYALLLQETERLTALAAKLDEEEKSAEKSAHDAVAEIFASHMNKVETSLKEISEELEIPFKSKEAYQGSAKPDFAVSINDRYVLFAAVVPGSPETQDTFGEIVSAKAEELLFAGKDENVRNEMYLVVPTISAEYVSKFVYKTDERDSVVYVVTPEALEAIVSTLKRVDEYEFTRQLTPFEISQICKFVGELSYVTKRKIELDTYFSNELLTVLQKGENLPTDVAEAIVESETAVKVTMPVERKSVTLTVPSLSEKVQKLEKAMLARAAVSEATSAEPFYEIEEPEGSEE